jgi:hypothetical protein
MMPDARDVSRGLTALASIRRYARPREPREWCGLCDGALAVEHSHLVEMASGQMVCACEACAILLGDQEGGRYRRVPRDRRFLADFQLSDVAWEGLGVPINLAFFLRSTLAGRVVARYPSPGGATESLVPVDAWDELVEENPVLLSLAPDVECLLVNRVAGACDCYRVGIDECYKLVGLVRTTWRGMTGGTAIWIEITRFFDELKGRSTHA